MKEMKIGTSNYISIQVDLLEDELIHIYRCPHCGAAVAAPTVHETWHRQLRGTLQRIDI